MRYGTSHFVSFVAAKRYYAKQGYKAADVSEMINNGTIHIGRPERKAGESIGLDADERYWIIIERSTMTPMGKV